MAQETTYRIWQPGGGNEPYGGYAGINPNMVVMNPLMVIRSLSANKILVQWQ